MYLYEKSVCIYNCKQYTLATKFIFGGKNSIIYIKKYNGKKQKKKWSNRIKK